MYETLVGFLAALRASVSLGSLITKTERCTPPFPSPIAAVWGKIREIGAGFLGSATKLQEAL
jgi:hypothetical protein